MQFVLFDKLKDLAGLELWMLLAAWLMPVRAQAAQNNYYYPGYDAASNGDVDLMRYIKQITMTVNSGNNDTLRIGAVLTGANATDYLRLDDFTFQKTV